MESIQYHDSSQREVNFFDTLEAVTKLNEIQQSAEISLEEASVSIVTDKPILVSWMSDIHLFSRYTDHSEFKKDITLVKQNEGVYVTWMGDLIDHGGKHSLASEDRLGLDEQIAALRGLLLNLKDRTLGVVSGNHELFSSIIGDDPAHSYMAGVKAPYFRSGGVLNLTVGDTVYKLLLHHKGKGGGGANPNSGNKRLQDLWCPEADVVVSGHIHQANIEIADRNDGAYRRTCTYIRAGTYKTGPDAYARGNGFAGGHKGGICTIFHPDEKKTYTFRRLEDGIECLNLLRAYGRGRTHGAEENGRRD